MIAVVTRPNPASIGNLFHVSGDAKDLCKVGCLNLSHITERLTNANTMRIPKTETLASKMILPEDTRMVIRVRTIVSATAIQGVLREPWIVARLTENALSFAIP